MWFKQIQCFQLDPSIARAAKELETKFEALAFTPCLPSLPFSMGWTSPIAEESTAPMRHLNDCTSFCLQVEEKYMPAAVIRQELDNKVKEIEATYARKVYSKEKLSLKDEIVLTLMPRAFSKISRIYAYIDAKNNWLVLNSSNQKTTERFLTFFKKTIEAEVQPLQVKKVSSILTHWLKHRDYPEIFAIEKSCVLQDPSQQNRMIRCQQQDLFSPGIQSLIKDNCEVKQLALSWQDRVNFVLTDDFTIRSIKYQEEIISQVKDLEAETKQQQFDASFFIMTQTLAPLLKDLMNIFVKDM